MDFEPIIAIVHPTPIQRRPPTGASHCPEPSSSRRIRVRTQAAFVPQSLALPLDARILWVWLARQPDLGLAGDLAHFRLLAPEPRESNRRRGWAARRRSPAHLASRNGLVGERRALMSTEAHYYLLSV